MNVSLTPEFENMIQQKVKSGFYNNASEVIREALRLLEEQDELKRMRLEELKKQLRHDIDSKLFPNGIQADPRLSA